MRSSYIGILIHFIRIIRIHSSFCSKWKLCYYIQDFAFRILLSLLLTLFLRNCLVFKRILHQWRYLIRMWLSPLIYLVSCKLISLLSCAKTWMLLMKYLQIRLNHPILLLIHYLNLHIVIRHLLDSLQSLVRIQRNWRVFTTVTIGILILLLLLLHFVYVGCTGRSMRWLWLYFGIILNVLRLLNIWALLLTIAAILYIRIILIYIVLIILKVSTLRQCFILGNIRRLQPPCTIWCQWGFVLRCFDFMCWW